MQESQTFSFTDGGRASHTACIEPGEGEDTLILNIFGKQHSASICLHREPDACPPLGRLASAVNVPIAELCYALLHAFRNIWCLSYGAAATVEMDGRRLIARYQEHPPDAGNHSPHPGVTLYEHA